MKTALKFALAGASALAFAAPGYAQTGDEIYQANNDDAIANGDIIIVEGRRRLESEQDVPTTINVVTQEDLQKLNLREGQDIAAVVPGLQLSISSGNGIGGSASLRGVNFDINASGQNPTVEFYQNDAPITAQVFLQANYDIAQIETLRGPQGTLRGRASPSGAITVRTRRPDLYAFGGYVDATGNDIGGMNFNGAVGVPIIDGVLGVRLAGLYSEDEGNRVTTAFDNVGSDRRDPISRTRSGRVSVLFEPTDWLNVFANYQKIDRDQRFFPQVACNPFAQTGGGVVAGGGAVGVPDSQDATDANQSVCSLARDTSATNIRGKDRKGISDLANTTHTEIDIYNGTAELSFGGQNLIYTGNYYELALQTRDPGDAADVFPGTELSLFTDTLSKNETHELRLQNDERLFNGLLDYVVGGFIQTTDTPSVLVNEILPGFVPIPLGAPPAPSGAGLYADIVRLGDTKEKSIFGNITLHPTDKLELSAGARYIDYTSDSVLTVTTNTTLGGAPLALGAPNVQPFAVDESRTIYAASASYDITDDIMAYASFGTSYRPPIFAVGCFNANCDPAISDVFDALGIEDGETSESYEIGLKTSLFDNRMRLNVSAFHQDFNNFPFRASGAGVYYVADNPNNGSVTGARETIGQFNFVSGVPVEVNGIEAEIMYEFSDNFNLGATLAYADGQIKNGNIPCNDFDNGGDGDGTPDDVLIVPAVSDFDADEYIRTCNVDQRSSFSSPFQASIFGEFTMPVNDDIGYFLRGLFDFDGKSKGDPTNSIDDVSDYGILNLYTGIRDPNGAWELSAFGKNIFDTYKVLTRDLTPAGSPAAGGASQLSDYSFITSTRPQEFGVNLRYRFGSDN